MRNYYHENRRESNPNSSQRAFDDAGSQGQLSNMQRAAIDGQ